MSTTAFRETPEFLRGQQGEKLVARIVQAKGWMVIASYDFSGSDGDKAPKLIGRDAGYVIPDLDASRSGKRIWIEVKTKAHADWTRITQRYEHGIPWRHFRDYQRVERETGCAVWLAIVEEDSGDVLIQKLSELEPRESASARMGRMAFFARDAFMPIGKR